MSAAPAAFRSPTHDGSSGWRAGAGTWSTSPSVDRTPGYKKLERAFRQTVDDPGLGVLTAEAGLGKTAAIRNLCAQLSKPDHLVLYLCDTAVAPLDLYRTLATEIGVKPSHRRAQLWSDIKKTLVHMGYPFPFPHI